MAKNPDPRHLEIALHHANIIQHQKDTEHKILDFLEKLIDYPLSQSTRVESPSSSDEAEVRSMLSLFRPSDFDDLLEERHCATKCGYVFCSRPPTLQNSTAKFRLIKTKTHGLQAIPREKLELWCSMDCARRAMYVKVQLSEEPAWLRQSGASPSITFLTGDGDSATKTSKAEAVSTTDTFPVKGSDLAVIAKTDDLSDGMAALALERGQSTDISSKVPDGVIRPDIVEKITTKPTKPPTLEEEATASSNTIEGYQIGVKTKQKPELGDRDWDL
jgi:hypothetical protein